MPRVMHVISALFNGGGQRLVSDLVRWLSRASSLDVRLCTLGREAEAGALSDLAHAGIDYDGRYNNIGVLWHAARALRAEARRQQIDILHTHGTDADLIGAIAVRQSRIAHVCHVHITPVSPHRTTWRARGRRRLFQILAARNRTMFVAVSEAVKDQMAANCGISGDRIVTVRNGIDLEYFGDYSSVEPSGAEQRRCGPIVIGIAARLAPGKGVEQVIRAATGLRGRGVRFELRIAGSGGERQSFERLVTSLKVTAAVRFLGDVADMRRFYRDLDVFVLPSESEGLPLVVLEAMATGCPVVATRVGGVPEVISHRENGMLVEPCNARALEEALVELAADPEARERLGRAARDRVKSSFGMARVVAEIARVYERVLADR